MIYNSGRFRMSGHGSMAGMMPYGDANAIMMEMAREVLPVVKNVPVLAGVCGTDPMRIMPLFLKKVRDEGFAGIQNFPTVGLIDGMYRENLEETGMGYYKEVELVRHARELDLLTTPYVFTPQDAIQMTNAGADILVAHMGLTTNGSIGAKTAKTLEQSVELIRAIAKAAHGVRSDALVICHGGPIAEPADAQFIMEQLPEIDGFYGASSMERLPTERAITEQTRAFTRIGRKK